MGIEVQELNGFKKVQAAIRLSEEEFSAPDPIEAGLAKIAKEFKKAELPPRGEANIRTFVKQLGSSGAVDCEPQAATVAAKITWKTGVRREEIQEGFLPRYNDILEGLLYGD